MLWRVQAKAKSYLMLGLNYHTLHFPVEFLAFLLLFPTQMVNKGSCESHDPKQCRTVGAVNHITREATSICVGFFLVKDYSLFLLEIG